MSETQQFKFSIWKLGVGGSWKNSGIPGTNAFDVFAKEVISDDDGTYGEGLYFVADPRYNFDADAYGHTLFYLDKGGHIHNVDVGNLSPVDKDFVGLDEVDFIEI